MLIHDAVREGRIVFRFVVGSLLIRSKPPKMAARKMVLDERRSSDYAALERELAEHSDDIVQLDAIDGPGVAMECPLAREVLNLEQGLFLCLSLLYALAGSLCFPVSLPCP